MTFSVPTGSMRLKSGPGSPLAKPSYPACTAWRWSTVPSCLLKTQRPHSLIGKAGAVHRLFAPRHVWTGTLGTAQNAVIVTTAHSRIPPGQLSSVCFVVQPRSGNGRSPNDPVSGRRSVQVRLPSRLTSFGRTTFFCHYGPFVSAAIGLKRKYWVSERPYVTKRVRKASLARETPPPATCSVHVRALARHRLVTSRMQEERGPSHACRAS